MTETDAVRKNTEEMKKKEENDAGEEGFSMTAAAAEKSAQTPGTADLKLSLNGEPVAVHPGEILEYCLTVENLGPDTAEHAEVIVSVPKDFLDPRISEDGGKSFHPWYGSAVLETIPPGSAKTLLLRGIVASDAAQPLVSTASVVSSETDPHLGNNCDTVVTALRSARAQALTGVLQSAALQETALAGLLQAEGAVLQKCSVLGGADDLIQYGIIESVKRIVESAVRMENVLHERIKSVLK